MVVSRLPALCASIHRPTGTDLSLSGGSIECSLRAFHILDYAKHCSQYFFYTLHLMRLFLPQQSC